MLISVALLLASIGFAEASSWVSHQVAGVTVHVIAAGDGRLLPVVTEVIARALRDLSARPELGLCDDPQLFVHPDLGSYLTATGLPWFSLAAADRESCRIDVQRLAVVMERSGLNQTLRHELFHLAQPADWARWRAEGEALLFAGEVPQAVPFGELPPGQLDALLRSPPDQLTQLRAAATARAWVLQGR